MRDRFLRALRLLGRTLGMMTLLAWAPPEQGQAGEDRALRPPPPQKEEERFRRLIPRKARSSDIVLIGKTVCSLRREVWLAGEAEVVSVPVSVGQGVRKGDSLARLRTIGGPSTKIGTGTVSQRGGTPVGEARAGRDRGSSENEVTLKAPMDGHLIWMHNAVREGGWVTSASPLFVVGVMNPMLVQAQVYEEEALRLAPGDMVNAYPESLPGRRFKARVSRVSWTPLSLDTMQPSYYEVELTMENPELILREGMRIILHLFKPLKEPPQDPPREKAE